MLHPVSSDNLWLSINIFYSFSVLISGKFSKRNGKLCFAEGWMGVLRSDCDQKVTTKRNVVKSL